MKTKINYVLKQLVSREVEELELDFCIEARQQYLADKLQLQKDLNAKRKDIIDAEIAYPFSATKVVQLKLELEDLERGELLMNEIGVDNGWV